MLGGQLREVVVVDPRTTDERRTRRAAFEPESEFLEHTPGRAVPGIDRRDDSMDARFVEQRIHDRADCLGGVSVALRVGDDRVPDGRLPPAVTDGNRDVADRPSSQFDSQLHPGIVRGAIERGVFVDQPPAHLDGEWHLPVLEAGDIRLVAVLDEALDIHRSHHSNAQPARGQRQRDHQVRT